MGSGLELLMPDDAAKYLGVSVQTLRWWRYRRSGPTFCRIGARRVAYRRADLDAFVQSGEVNMDVAHA